ncbi:MAG TPA: hypothetical protein VIL49_01820 [Capillimicrobium sp.]
MHSHLTIQTITARRVEAEHARRRPTVARNRHRRIALRLPHRHTAARQAVRPA